MDFGERLAAKIKADVERRIEMYLAGDAPEIDLKGTTRLALVGLVPPRPAPRRGRRQIALVVKLVA